MEVLIRSNKLFDKITEYIKQNESVAEILIYGFLDKALLKKLNEFFTDENRKVSYKFIIPKIQYYKSSLIYMNQSKMDKCCQVRINPKCNKQFIIIDNLFLIVSGIKNKEECFSDNLVVLSYDDKEALDILKKTYIEDWESSYSIHL